METINNSTETIKIRIAKLEDAKDILKIYEFYINNTTASFEAVVPSVEEYQERMQSIMYNYPYLVCCIEGVIVGYAYANRYRTRSAYDWDVELAVYMEETYHNRGCASMLYKELFELLKMQGIRKLYACITSPNNKSEQFHRKQGFRKVAVFQKTGYKMGQWLDVVWMEKDIYACDGEPVPFKSIEELKIDTVHHLFEGL